MLQRIFTYITYILFLFAMLYLLYFIWWLFLPIFILVSAFAAWRIYQVRKLWNSLLKQAQNVKAHKRYQKIDDDNIIDVDYEEIKS